MHKCRYSSFFKFLKPGSALVYYVVYVVDSVIKSFWQFVLDSGYMIYIEYKVYQINVYI